MSIGNGIKAFIAWIYHVLFIYQLMGIWIISIFWPLRIIIWTLIGKFLCGYRFLILFGIWGDLEVCRWIGGRWWYSSKTQCSARLTHVRRFRVHVWDLTEHTQYECTRGLGLTEVGGRSQHQDPIRLPSPCFCLSLHSWKKQTWKNTLRKISRKM